MYRRFLVSCSGGGGAYNIGLSWVVYSIGDGGSGGAGVSKSSGCGCGRIDGWMSVVCMYVCICHGVGVMEWGSAYGGVTLLLVLLSGALMEGGFYCRGAGRGKGREDLISC